MRAGVRLRYGRRRRWRGGVSALGSAIELDPCARDDAHRRPRLDDGAGRLRTATGGIPVKMAAASENMATVTHRRAMVKNVLSLVPEQDELPAARGIARLGAFARGRALPVPAALGPAIS